MPPLPALHIKALDELVRQLRFAPPGAARRQMERTEELFGVIDPGQNYPEDWVVNAITGYRPDVASPALIVGAALLGDLGVLVERFSDAAELTEADLPGLRDPEPQWLDADQLCARWNISRKTLDRYRRRPGEGGGVLPARRVRAVNGRDKLYFALRFVRGYEARHGELLRKAGAFSRLEPAMEARLLRRAARYRARMGWSLNRAAERLAERTGRGHETIRQLLQRHSETGNGTRQIFTERGPLTERERRVISRAYASGVEVERLASHFGRTRPSVYRVLARERADFLRSLALAGAELMHAGRAILPREGGAALEPESVRSGLGRPAPGTLAEMLREAEADPLPDPRAERERALAYWHLRVDAARLVGRLPRHNPSAGACDEIEARLRWASRLKAELVRSQFALAFRTIRSGLEREISSISRGAASELLDACLRALTEGVDQFDPSRGGRLAAPCGLALSRAVTRWARGSTPLALRPGARAAAFVQPESLVLRDWTRHLDAWQARLEPDARARRALPSVEPHYGRFLEARFGWAPPGGAGAGPPRTLAQLASEFSLTLHHAAALERTAIAAAIRAARVSETPHG